MAFHDHFEIDIVAALSDQLELAFEDLEVSPFSTDAIEQVEQEQGVYILFLNEDPVYVGKADSGGLRKRLQEHHHKISGRRNIDVSDMGFKCLYVHRNWTSLAPEKILIKHFKDAGHGEWNGIGFGPHDPGRDRETTAKPPHGFDNRFPIRDDWPVGSVAAGEHNARELLMAMKTELPFLLRYQTANSNRWRDGDPAYNDVIVDVPADGMPARDLLRVIAEAIPDAQATVFVSHMILYIEEREYPHGEVIWPEG